MIHEAQRARHFLNVVSTFSWLLLEILNHYNYGEILVVTHINKKRWSYHKWTLSILTISSRKRVTNKKRSKLLMTMSTDDISVLHTAEVIHFYHKSRKPRHAVLIRHTHHTSKVWLHRDAMRPFKRLPNKLVAAIVPWQAHGTLLL